MDLLLELRQSLRQFSRSRIETLLLCAVVATAVAIPTVTFAVVDGVLFKGLPYGRFAELFAVKADVPNVRSSSEQLSWNDVNAWLATLKPRSATALSYQSSLWYQTPERDVWMASADEFFFDVLQARPALGGFTSTDFEWTPATSPTETVWPVLISYRLWVQQFGGSPEVLGAVVRVSEREGRAFGYRVAGVLAQGFTYPLLGSTPQPDLIAPFPRLLRRGSNRQLALVVRVPAEQNKGEVEARFVSAWKGADSAADHGSSGNSQSSSGSERGRSIQLEPLQEVLTQTARPMFRVAFAAAMTIYVLVMLNVVGLWVARSRGEEEIAVRRAIGASSAAIMRLLWARSALVCLGATALLIPLVPGLLAVTLSLIPPSLGLVKVPDVDARVVVVAVAASIAAALVIALGTASAVADRSSTLLRGRISRKGGRLRITEVLLGLQIVIGVVLASLASIAGKAWLDSWQIQTGFKTESRAFVDVRANAYRDPAEASDQLRRGFAQLQNIYGSSSVAASSIQPTFASGTAWANLKPVGQSGPIEGTAVRAVSSNYFELMELEFIEGRMAPTDWKGTTPLAVVSRRAAELLWPGRTAIGQVLQSTSRTAAVPTFSVVAVVEDARYQAMDREPIGDIYVPDPLGGGFSGSIFFVQTDTPNLGAIEREMRGVGLLVIRADTVEDALFAGLRHKALPAWLFGVAGLVSFPIMALGVLSTTVASLKAKEVELDIRWALGATARPLMSAALGSSAIAVGAGVIGGSLVAYATLLGPLAILDPQQETATSTILVSASIVLGFAILMMVPSAMAAAKRQFALSKT
jgi:hypothetical protein